jgi:hypothetical protein
VQVSFTQEKIMEQETDFTDNGLYYDWWDIENAFMWGVFVGALLAGALVSILGHYGFAI